MIAEKTPASVATKGGVSFAAAPLPPTEYKVTPAGNTENVVEDLAGPPRVAVAEQMSEEDLVAY